MRSLKHNLFCIIALLLFSLSHAYASEARTALVIGNTNYDAQPLTNPVNDAEDMAKALEKIGFDVTVALDLDALNLDLVVEEFTNTLDQRGGYGFFYFAGHGVSISNENYLIGVDSTMKNASSIKYRESIAVNDVLERMAATRSSLNLLVLDACRDNPFQKNTGNRSANAPRGLSAVEPLQGSMVVFATAAGSVANDGDKRNGTFTEHFLKHLVEPGLTLTQIVKNTKLGVRNATASAQRPWVKDDLTREYILYPKADADKPEPKPYSAVETEMSLWYEVVTKNSVDSYAAYLSLYPKGKYIDLASRNLELLKNPADNQVASNSQAAELEQPVNPVAKTEDKEIVDTVVDTQVAMLTPETTVEISPPPKKSESRIPTPESQNTISGLTINTTPATERIFIMNIVPPYRPGMLLEKNKSYDIWVRKAGYQDFRETVFIEKDTMTFDVTLTKLPTPQKKQTLETAPLPAAQTAPQTSKPQQKKIAHAVLPGLKNIQSGKFNMGCSTSDNLCLDAEAPVSNVSIQPFQIGESEVTVGEFKQFVDQTGYITDAEKNAGGFTGCLVRIERDGLNRDNSSWSWKNGAHWRNPAFAQTDDHPVTCVSWNDAIAYTKWMTNKYGQTVRLPTEAEWEYAARAGSNKRYGTLNSSKNLCRNENGADESKSPFNAGWAKKMKCNDGHWNTAPVKSYSPNAFGLYDTLGNVHEWTQDVWQSKFQPQDTSGRPNLAGDANQRTIRGGAWDKAPSRLRVSVRSPSDKTKRASMIGFRVVRELVIQSAR